MVLESLAKKESTSRNDNSDKDYTSNEFVSIQVILLQLGGVLPPEICYSTPWKMKLYNIIALISILWYLPSMMSQYIVFYRDWGNIFIVTSMIFEMIAPVNNLAITFYLMTNRQHLRSILQTLDYSFQDHITKFNFQSKHQSILNEAARQIKSFSKPVTVLNVLTYLLYIVKPLVLWWSYTDNELDDSEVTGDILELFVYRTWLPKNATKMPLYLLIWAYEIVIPYLIIMGFGGYNLLFCALTTFASSHFKILAMLIEDVNDIIVDQEEGALLKSSTKENKSISEENNEGKISESIIKGSERNAELYLTRCVEYHQAILKFCEEIDDLFSPALLVLFMLNGVMMCVTAFRATDIAQDQNVGRFLSSAGTCWCTFMLICWFGERLTERSSAIEMAAYGCKWYNSSTTVKKYLMNIIMRAQSPVVLKAGKMFPVSLQGFSSVANNVYAYFTVLQGMKEK